MATGDMCGVGAVFEYEGPTCVSSQTSDDMFWQYNRDFENQNFHYPFNHNNGKADPFLQEGIIGLKCPGPNPATGKYPGDYDGMKPYYELDKDGFVSCMHTTANGHPQGLEGYRGR